MIDNAKLKTIMESQVRWIHNRFGDKAVFSIVNSGEDYSVAKVKDRAWIDSYMHNNGSITHDLIVDEKGS